MSPINLSRLESLRVDTILAGADLAAMRPRFERLASRHETGTVPRAVSSFQLFQTPEPLARRLVEAADVRPGMRILEPSAGLGRILDALPPGDVVAVEMAAMCARELFQQNREGVRLVQRDFLTCEPSELGTFDRVVMNPPFHMRADIAHIRHAMRFLRHGGRLAAICMATSHRERALRHLALKWEELPPDTFAKEGTRVPAVLAVFDPEGSTL